MSENYRKNVDEYSKSSHGFVYRPKSMRRVSGVLECNRLRAQLKAVQDAVPWEWLEMANKKYGSEIFPDPYQEN